MRCFQRFGREDVGEKKTETFSHLNQLINIHLKLNNHYLYLSFMPGSAN